MYPDIMKHFMYFLLVLPCLFVTVLPYSRGNHNNAELLGPIGGALPGHAV